MILTVPPESYAYAKILFPVRVIFPSLNLNFLQVHLTLSETDTIWLLDFPGTSVAEDSEIAEGIKEKNQKYEEVSCCVWCIQFYYVCSK